MAQINKDYFIRDILISRVNSESGSSSIDSSIDKFEKEVLLKVLGYDLYQLFIANPTDQRFIELSQGAEFEFDFCGKTVKRKYVGFKNTEKESLIAYYVYFKHQSVNQTFTSTVSEVKPSTENASPASANEKLMRAWNNFVDLSGSIAYNGRYNGEFFDVFNLSSYTYYNADPSMYNFLLANIDVYPEWEFTPTDKIRLFNI